jgi:hypothetical protein
MFSIEATLMPSGFLAPQPAFPSVARAKKSIGV